MLWQASLRAEREGNNCLTTAKIMLFSETRNFFTSFFRLLTGERCFPAEGQTGKKGGMMISPRRAEGQKEPALLLLQKNTRTRQFTYISLVAKEMLHIERIFILAARLTRHCVMRTDIEGVAQRVRRDCGISMISVTLFISFYT